MNIDRLHLFGFRNRPDGSIDFDSDRILIVGPNGRGKTNLLEAICYLFTGKSFRTSKTSEMIAFGRDRMSVGGAARTGGQPVELRIETAEGKRTPFANGAPTGSWSDYLSYGAVLGFTPWDGWIVRGGASERRPFLDRSVFLLDSDHFDRVLGFNRLLAQRNALLKRIAAQPQRADELDGWDPAYAQAALEVTHARREHVQRILPFWKKRHRQLTGGDLQPDLRYRPSIDPEEGVDDRQRFLGRLHSLRKEEIRLGSSSLGPHREELWIGLQNQPLRAFGSQGQIRAALLAYRLAEADAYEEKFSERPILLLDDVFGELDAQRCKALFEILEEAPMQCFITAAEPRPELAETDGWKVVSLEP